MKTTIEQGSRLSSQQVIRVPLKHLARTIQAMHSKGLLIESIDMGFGASAGSGLGGETSQKKAASPKANKTETSSKSSSKRSGRKRRN
jgi:hypothetical protein